MKDERNNWTEDYIESLPQEDNRLERKGSRIDGWSDDKLREELAKQLSAFANTGGGSLILGAHDQTGIIDGGLSLIHKGKQSTKDWLEDIIPHCVEPEIIGCRVVELQRSSAFSHIDTDRVVLVVEIPDSERAPHQSVCDRRYYVRLGSKSLPASHRLIEDIRNRSVHPRVTVESIEINSMTFEGGHGYDRVGRFRPILKLIVANDGDIRARNTCLGLSSTSRVEFSKPMPMGLEARSRGKNETELLFEFRDTLYPHMRVEFNIPLMFAARLIPLENVSPVRFEIAIGNGIWRELALTTAIYADSAPRFSRQFAFLEIDPHHKVDEFLNEYRAAFMNKNPMPYTRTRSGWMGN